MESNKLKIIIADDHPVVLEGLKEILSKEKTFDVIKTVVSGNEVVVEIRKDYPDILILDVNMPGKNGIEVIRDVKMEFPELPILVLSIYPEDQLALRVIKAGASGYLNKDQAPMVLIEAINQIIRGNKYLSPNIVKKLVDSIGNAQSKHSHEDLTDREYEVLISITSGSTVKEIAKNLHVSEKTIRTYRERILKKLNLKNEVELTHYAIRNKLIS